MDPLPRFNAVCEAMADPDFYPHPVFEIQRRDTHISVVFLTGQWVYKLKKPLNLGFLDFREIEERAKFCEQEVRLNRRLSKGIYLNTVIIAENEKNVFSLSESGNVVEYAVKMKQLPDEARLGSLLKKNAVSRYDLELLGKKLAAFYLHSKQNSQIDQYGQRDMVIFNSEENFQQIVPFVSQLIDREKWQFICEVNRSFLYHHHVLFERRLENRKIRDGHGDLRTDHIYFFDGIQIIDCIEFNDRFRYGDVAIDLAFLHMDMELLGYPEESQVILKSYVEHANDPEIYALIDFYAAYRAIVRLKVACIRHNELKKQKLSNSLQVEINTHLNQAYRYTLLFSRPTLWVFSGLPASGKSSLAQRLSRILSIMVISSDAVRKEKDFEPEIVSFDSGKYSKERRQRVYAKMLALAQKKLKKGRSVLLDATYSLRRWRQEVVQLASDMDSNLIFVECKCNTDIIRKRLIKRENYTGLSDARIQHLPDIIKNFEPITELSKDIHIKIETQIAIEQTLYQLLSEAYLCKSAQIETII
ncbi:MAG: AAA family ATPase [Desulfobacterales bacterium]